MAEEKGGSWSLPWPTVLTIVTLIGGVSAFFTPLVSSRPSGAAAKSTFTLGDQSVDARLWQDPLVPTQQHYDLLQWRAEKQGSTTQPSALVKAELLQRQIGRLTREIARKTRGGQRLLILPIMISGGPYPEDAESRLRTRHAVLSALSMAMFRPEDGEHLGYVAVPWPRELTEGAAPPALNDPLPSEPPLVIPYEWCRNIGPHRGINSTQPAARPRRRQYHVSVSITSF